MGREEKGKLFRLSLSTTKSFISPSRSEEKKSGTPASSSSSLAFSPHFLSLSNNSMHHPSAGSIKPLPLPPRAQQQRQHAWGAEGGEEMNVDNDATQATTTTTFAARASSHEPAAPPSFQQQQQSAGENAA